MVTSQEKTNSPEVQVIILDGPAIANMLRPGYAKKLSDYASSQVSVPAIHCVPNTACKPSRRCLGRVPPREFIKKLKQEVREERKLGNWKEV